MKKEMRIVAIILLVATALITGWLVKNQPKTYTQKAVVFNVDSLLMEERQRNTCFTCHPH